MKTVKYFLAAITLLTIFQIDTTAQSENLSDNLLNAQHELNQGNAAESYRLISEYVQTYPDSSKGWYFKSQIEQKVLKYKQALESISQAIVLEPAIPAYYYQISKVYSDLQQHETCVSYCDSVLQQDSTHFMATLLKAQALQKEDRFRESIDQYYSLHQRDTMNIFFMKRIGLLYSKMDSISDAITWFGKAIEVDSSDIPSYTQLGHLYILSQEYKVGISVLNKSILIDSTNSILYRFRGSLNVMGANFPEAEGDFIKAIELGDSTAFNFRHLGLVLFRQTKYDEALPIYQKTIKLDPEDSQAYYYLAYCYKWEEDFDKAIESMSKALQLSATPNISDVYTGLAQFHGYKREYDSSMHYYSRAYEWNQKDAVPLAEMGMLVEQTGGKKEKAKELYKSYLEKSDPNDVTLNKYIEERLQVINEKLFMEGKLDKNN